LNFEGEVGDFEKDISYKYTCAKKNHAHDPCQKKTSLTSSEPEKHVTGKAKTFLEHKRVKKKIVPVLNYPPHSHQK